MPDWNLFLFQAYRQDTFPLVERRLEDQQAEWSASSNHTIDASQLTGSFLFQVWLGQSSMLQLDQWLRNEWPINSSIDPILNPVARIRPC